MVEHIRFTPETANNWFRAMKEIPKQRPWLYTRVADSFTESQMESKLWLATEVKNLGLQPKHCVLLGGWFSHIITSILIEEFGAEFVMNYEIDRDVQYASFKFNRRYKDAGKYRCVRKDIICEKIGKTNLPKDPNNKTVARRVLTKNNKWFDYYHPDSGTGFDYGNKIISYDCIINTSCEHMFPMWKFKEVNHYGLLNQRGFKYSPLYILQSTDDDQYDDHINCVKSPEELADQAKLVDVLYSGSKVLSNGMTRFMVIGR